MQSRWERGNWQRLQYARLWVEEESVDMDDQEREGILEPFKFLFSKIEDMWTFSEEMSDKQGYLRMSN